MYKEKIIYNFTGKTCSGKSFISSLLDKKEVEIINLDELYSNFLNKTFNKKQKDENLEILKKHKKKGFDIVEKKSLEIIKNKILNIIENSNKKIILIDGIQAKKYFNNIIDVYVVFNAKLKIRKQFSKNKNWTSEKFNFINSLQKGM